MLLKPSNVLITSRKIWSIRSLMFFIWYEKVTKKFEIANYPGDNILNKRTEIIVKCRHRRKHLLTLIVWRSFIWRQKAASVLYFVLLLYFFSTNFIYILYWRLSCISWYLTISSKNRNIIQFYFIHIHSLIV